MTQRRTPMALLAVVTLLASVLSFVPASATVGEGTTSVVATDTALVFNGLLAHNTNDGTSLAVFQSGAQPFNVRAVPIDADGQARSGLVTVHDIADRCANCGDQFLAPGTLAFNPSNNEYLLVWIELQSSCDDRSVAVNDNADRLCGQRLDSLGRPIGPGIEMMASQTCSLQDFSVVTNVDTDEYVLTTTATGNCQFITGSTDINHTVVTQRFNGFAMSVSPPTVVSGGGSRFGTLTYNPVTREFLASWLDSDGSWFQRLNANAAPIGSPTKFGEANVARSAIGVGEDGTYAIISGSGFAGASTLTRIAANGSVLSVTDGLDGIQNARTSDYRRIVGQRGGGWALNAGAFLRHYDANGGGEREIATPGGQDVIVQADGTILTLQLRTFDASVRVLPPLGPGGFSDVPFGAFYAEPVAWLKTEGITTGTSPTTYSPNANVTRGQMAAFLHRLVNEPTGSPDHGFTDITPGAFFDTPVNWLKNEGITTGTSPTTYSPNANVTRAQMAAFLWRLAGSPTNNPDHGFTDIPNGVFYDEAVNWLKDQDITTGTSPTTYSPNANVTRAQMAAFLFRMATNSDWTRPT